MGGLAETIRAFERTCGLRLSFHDYSGSLRGHLPPERFFHDWRPCHMAKKHLHPECVRFDNNILEARVSKCPDGFLKVCHAGIGEIVTPLSISGPVPDILFAGLFRVRPSAMGRPGALAAAPSDELLRNAAFQRLLRGLPELGPSELDDLSEVVGALRLRLEKMFEREEIFRDGRDKTKWLIDRFMRANCGRDVSMDDLARSLFLSKSRAGQLVREMFGSTFPRLLNAHRLGMAKTLLASSPLSIGEIAHRCGFSDPGYFFRTFKRHEAATPLEYRRRHMKKSGFTA